MKKFISVVLSMIMAVSVMAVATIPAFAAQSPQEVTHDRVISVEVNGSSSTDVSYSKDQDDPNKITFTYNGSGSVDHWEFPGLEVGTDYDILSDDGDSITIMLYADKDFTADAIIAEDEEEETTKKPGKQDKGPTSPKTGAMSAAGIAVAGAGVAILAALKKDEDAE